MKLQNLFEMQKSLDHHIEEKHNLTSDDLFDRKVLALLVEIGELANETRCFKFWSLKESNSKDVILEEFVDGIHFILSLGIESGYNHLKEINIERSPETSLSDQFLKIYELITTFRLNRSIENYKLVFESYLLLANQLGFTDGDIERAYVSKNEVNYKRQQEGY
ncbi:dUTP diphosphatase [Bacillus sp. 31A1R]|uniref:dUTP diphosphatase n=1 Tax=Robertmurraya mangrovi TaxID=3098077 RepID=A0ABU5IZ60_9BACI|nr:dUTP diphosphatase [Bacillus sp. 31A1R]MDZ5472459.1 dUTP diphosphatase [Bacillus sp. 31A1R]